jgi:hypothetical protein
MSLTQRQFTCGTHELVAAAPDDPVARPYLVAGPQLYALGYDTGEIRPMGIEHLVGEMGGIWAHPLKVADGLEVSLSDTSDAPLEADEGLFCASPAEASWRWSYGQLSLRRQDRALPGGPAYGILVTLTNEGSTMAAGSLRVAARLKFVGCWFGGKAAAGGSFQLADALVLGQDEAQSGWGLALGTATPPDRHLIEPRERGALVTLAYDFKLDPGARRAWMLLLTVGQTGGSTEASSLWQRLINDAPRHFDDEATAPQEGLPSLICADSTLARDIALAQANLSLLDANYPDLGRYFLAGLPEYPQLFGCDSAYTVAGAAAAGFGETCRAVLTTLADYAARACGRVPHELTTNGRVFHPGNIQETPQLALALWDHVRWTGDLALAERLFPVCREGLLDYLPSIGGPDPRYPLGDGMIERMGMGARKLDSACYHIAGLRALARLALALDEPEAAALSARADQLNQDFERDWWLESEGLYADSMHNDGRLQLDGHWTVVLPVQLGLAAPERAARALKRIEAEFVNQWGLVHTRGREELVWTLPTGLLALAAFAQGRAEWGLQLARNIALTAQHGTLGTFKELIPEGLCFVQLWSAGLYLQAIFEGLLGLQPDAPRHRLAIAPLLPAAHPPVTVYGLLIGQHRLNLTISPDDLQIEHAAGPCPLEFIYAGTSFVMDPGTVQRRTAP